MLERILPLSLRVRMIIGWPDVLAYPQSREGVDGAENCVRWHVGILHASNPSQQYHRVLLILYSLISCNCWSINIKSTLLIKSTDKEYCIICKAPRQ